MSRKWFTFLVCALIFLIPTNLFLSFPTGSEFVGGLRVDYLIPKLFLSDIVAAILIISFAIWQRNKVHLRIPSEKERLGLYLSLIAVMLCISVQFFTEANLISVITVLRIGMFISLMLILLQLDKVIEKSLVFLIIIATILFQSFVAWHQWLTQSSVYGYAFLGEPNFHIPLGLAKTAWQGREMILPYGTTAHPNVLGGIMAVFLIVLLKRVIDRSPVGRWQQVLISAAIITGFSTLLLTHSLSAIMAFSTGIALIILGRFINKKNTSLPYIKARYFFILLLVFSSIVVITLNMLSASSSSNNSVLRRERLNTAALSMVYHYPLIGVGFSNSTVYLDQSVSHGKVIVPFLQPVHNVVLLFFAEAGILGLVTLLGIPRILHFLGLKGDQLGWFSPKLPIAFLLFLPIAALDHYLITLQSGMLLITVAPFLFTKIA